MYNINIEWFIDFSVMKVSKTNRTKQNRIQSGTGVVIEYIGEKWWYKALIRNNILTN